MSKSVKTTIQMGPKLRDHLQNAARENSRSLSAEIRARLNLYTWAEEFAEQHVPADSPHVTQIAIQFLREIADLKRRGAA